MILDALVGLYERLAEREEVAAEGWCKAKVSYAVNLSEEGRITGILPMKTEADRGKKKVWVPVSLMVPEMVTRSSGVAANFLCDNSKYILGIDANGTSPRVPGVLSGIKGTAFEASERDRGQNGPCHLFVF